jgi:serine/threonine protein kinase
VDEVAFGRYRLISLIGEGGMGKVYKAHDTVIGRDVAIKVLPTELGAEPGYRERFRREAHTAAQLTHPNIIPIYDTGEIEGQLYLSMPIIDGIDVHNLLERDGPLPPQRAVRVIEQLAAALDAAHEAGLVHRDVKPSNALLTRRDLVYLIDFGIAHDAATTKLTRTGMVVGTFAYIAPERLTTGTADARADVYALACVLYECLTGEQPFPGDSAEQQIAGHLALEPPKPASLNPAIPAGFDEVIARGMAKDPDQRYQTATELADAARQALTTTPAPAHSPPTAATLLGEQAPPTPTTEPTLLDEPVPPAPEPIVLGEASPPTPPSAPAPMAQQQPGDLNLAATQQRPPDRGAGWPPHLQETQRADRPPPYIGVPPPPSYLGTPPPPAWGQTAAPPIYQASASGVTAIVSAVLSLLLALWAAVLASYYFYDAYLYGADFGKTFSTLALLGALMALVAVVLVLGGTLLLRRKLAGRNLILIGCVILVIRVSIVWFSWVADMGFVQITIDIKAGAGPVLKALGIVLAITAAVLAMLPATKRWCRAKLDSAARPQPPYRQQ